MRAAHWLLLLTAFRPGGAAAADTFENTVKPFVRQYCVACHNAGSSAGGVNLQQYLSQSSAEGLKDRAVWERVIQQLRAEQMPPRRAKQPPEEEIGVVTNWIEAEYARLDRK